MVPRNDEPAGVGNERTRGSEAARPGQTKPSGARYGVAAVLGRELFDVHERWRRSMNLDTCTYMGAPARRNRGRRSMARYRQGEPRPRTCLDVGGIAAPQEAHLLVHSWHRGCDPCLMCWLVSSPVDKRARFEVSGRGECWDDDGPICPWLESHVQSGAQPRGELARLRTGAATHARASTR